MDEAAFGVVQFSAKSRLIHQTGSKNNYRTVVSLEQVLIFADTPAGRVVTRYHTPRKEI